MCSIIGSFDKDTIVGLCELNAYRGQHSHSISYYDLVENFFCEIHRSLGPIDYRKIDIPDNAYCVVHMQAPTTDGKDTGNIHPAMIGNHILWHNGIIKQKEIKRLQQIYGVTDDWDTYILLKHMIAKGTPEGIDGSFSCLYFNNYRMHLFRNEISPMFIDDKFNISSTKFPNSTPTEANCMFLFEPGLKKLTPTLNFNTVENPYYFGE